MRYTITLSNDRTGEEREQYTIAVDKDGQIIKQNDVPDTGGPIVITGFAMATDRLTGDQKAFVSWEEFNRGGGFTDVLGYQIIQKLADGREEPSEFTVLIVSAQ